MSQVRARLYRTQCPWLVIFDNVVDRSLVHMHLPRGSRAAGHVLVTSRSNEPSAHSRVLLINCFTPSESIALLRTAGGQTYP